VTSSEGKPPSLPILSHHIRLNENQWDIELWEPPPIDDLDRETARYGVFPRVVWLVPDDGRRDALAEVISAGPSELRAVAAVHPVGEAMAALTAGSP
jgi:hypothetical protein